MEINETFILFYKEINLFFLIFVVQIGVVKFYCDILSFLFVRNVEVIQSEFFICLSIE